MHARKKSAEKVMAHAVQVFAFLLGLAAVRATPYSTTCSPPDIPNYGGYYGVHEQHYSVGSVLTYYCDHGYAMYGRSWTVCSDGNRGPYWLYPVPSCRLKVVQCDRLSDIRYGRVILTGTAVGSTCTYSCNRGYILVGGATRTCQASGLWTGREPFCQYQLKVVQCDRLSDIRYGRVILTGTTVGSTCTYSCDKGYILVGGATRTCRASGLWTGKEPFCRYQSAVVDCGLILKAPINGFVQVPCTTPYCIATYWCRIGYTLEGYRSRTCQANGYWSHETPVCQLAYQYNY